MENSYNFDPEKNKKLIESRGISFEENISIIETKGPLDIINNYKKTF